MTKKEFLARLSEGLSGLPESEREERLTFYGEMIDDRMEDGIPEETAVGEIGEVEKVISSILSETPLTMLVKEKLSPKRKPKTWEVILLILGSPLWIALLLAALAVILAVFAALFAVILALWACFASFVACSFAGVVGGIGWIAAGKILPGIALVGAGLLLTGISIILFFACRAATKGILLLVKAAGKAVKRTF